MFFIKGILFLILTVIFIQDFKDRMVWVFLFPFFAVLGSFLYFDSSNWEVYKITILINLAIVGILLLLNYLVATYVFKKKFLKEAFGVGDILFIIAFSLSFPTISFINFFVFSLLFTIVIHFLLKKIRTPHNDSVPLAGAMSLFLMAVYICHWLGWYDALYFI